MNITKLVASLQKAANTSTTTAELANLSRAIKGLNIGTVQTVANTTSLPAMLSTNGNLYYVESEQDLYYNVGGTWNRFYTEQYTIYSWGSNASGRLGDGTSTSRSSPATTVGNITTWKQVAAGDQHSLGVTTTGIAYAWGSNANGRLGDGTTTSRSSPVTVVGGIVAWSQIAAGFSHSLALTSAGIAYAWGLNSSGQLGDNTTSARSSPVTVVGGISTWNQISTEGSHSLGLTIVGIAYAWGSNSQGQLGDNTTSSRSSPVTVVGGITTWSQINGGGYHNLGLISTGILYAWGQNSNGQLGDGTTTNRSSPISVLGNITNWSKISAGGYHNLTITSSGVAYSWGYAANGRLGDGQSATNRSSPVTIIGGITNWNNVSASRQKHSLGILNTGILYAWGNNSNGELGDNTTVGSSSPVTVIGSFTNWSQVSAGGYFSLGLTTTII
jgi:alpha-tubulin suppressor-like RCC1 family protein